MKKVAIGIGVILGIVLLVPVFVKNKYSVARSIEIGKPKTEVFEYIRFLKNQDNFSKWAKMDPNMTKEYRGEDGRVGFISAWESKKDDVGKGEQEILSIQEGKRIDYELRFIEPFESKSKAYLLTESSSETSTKVTWGFEGKMNYPMNAMLLFMDFEKMIGDDFIEGLQNLKKILEKP